MISKLNQCRKIISRLFPTMFALSSFICGQVIVAEESASFTDAHLEFFEKEVRPLLIKRCYECHSSKSEEVAGSLLLDSRASILTGGDSGAAIELGKPSESLMIDAINYGDYEMPPKSKMPAKEIEILTKWVKLGAPWPTEKAPDSTKHKKEFDIDQLKSEHWCWTPLSHPQAPQVKNQAWPKAPLDNFILAKLEAASLQPNKTADKNTLLRRVTYDLTGLPPTPSEIQDFLADSSPKALEKAVDRLLSSPRFGEHWGRHWLDLMRYAESRGHEFDPDTPNAYQYRDYVIRALNADVPYDDFVIEHLAGDMLETPRLNAEAEFNESVLATGFWYLGEWIHSPVDIRQDEADRFDNAVDVMSKSFLGLTVACARCHDHKFDPIPQADYYSQFGFLQSSAYRQVRFESYAHNKNVSAQLKQLDNASHQQAANLIASSITNNAEQKIDTLLQNKKVLQVARKNVQHPLHLWAKHFAGQSSVSDTTTQSVQNIAKATTAKQQQSQEAWSKVQSVIDYRNLDPRAWRSDGFVFGTAPVSANQLILSTDAANPIEGLHSETAAVRDARWNGLKLTAGTSDDAGKLAGWNRAGRTLKTPSFDLKVGRIHYLVRGGGRAFAVVDSHRLVQGPLHGRVITQWKPDKTNSLRWITHDLRSYQGHGVHVEFVPLENHPLEIVAVVEGETAPALNSTTASEDLALLLSKIDSEQWTKAKVKQLVTKQIATAADEIKSKKFSTSGQATVNRWVVKNLNYLVDNSESLTTQLAQIATEHHNQSNQLKSKIKLESRTAPAIWDGSGVDEKLLIRGNAKNTGETTKRGILQAIYPDRLEYGANTSGRLSMARRLMQPENPFASRVIVNRVWHHLTGQGIVASVDNFGVLGQKPTHPQLLDHLANTFMEEDNWSLKKFIRRVVLSQTYAMSSSPGGKGEEVDPKNELLHRMRIRRLTGESIRDGILQVSGRLDTKMYGPGVPVHLTQFMQGRGRPRKSGPIDGEGRRSIYITVRRNFLSPMMLAFDTPAPFTAIGKRTSSNVPAQSLILLNDPFVVQQAKIWGEKLAAENSQAIEERIASMYVKAFGRDPMTEEVEFAQQFLVSQAKLHGINDESIAANKDVWSDLAHAILNTKEYIFIR